MKLSSGMNVLVGPSTRARLFQPAQVMTNGFTVNYTRSAERYHAQAHAELSGKKLNPEMQREIDEIVATGITRSGFHKFPSEVTRKKGYAQVLVGGKHINNVRTNKLHEPV